MNDSEQAYDRIIRPIEEQMIKSIWRIVRNGTDAEDAMQDALLTVSKRWDRIVAHPSPQAFVLKICLDAAYDLTRRRKRQWRVVELIGTGPKVPASSRAPPDEIGGDEQYLEIMAAIHRLSRHQAIATLMRIVQELSYEQIAAAMGCTEATVRKHVARSRERLQLWLAHLNPTLRERD